MSRAIESSFFDHNMIDANKILNTNVEGDYHTPFKGQFFHKHQDIGLIA